MWFRALTLLVSCHILAPHGRLPPQVLFSTSVFSRLWAARTELRDARLRSEARKAATTTDTLYGPSTHAPNREEHKFAGTEPAAYAYVDPISSSL